MLPQRRRLRRPDDFAATIRRGVRAGRGTVVVHLSTGPVERPAIAGFVVSKAVGNSVVRHRVVRRLRHLMSPVLTSLPAGTRVVVRALPAASVASSLVLDADLRSGLAGAQRKLVRGGSSATRAGQGSTG